MATNADSEMRWVDAWEALLAITGGRADYPGVLPNGDVVNVEACKAWLQAAAYEACEPHVQRGWHRGRPAVVAGRA